jgi:hypothetical protein
MKEYLVKLLNGVNPGEKGVLMLDSEAFFKVDGKTKKLGLIAQVCPGEGGESCIRTVNDSFRFEILG